MPMPPLRLFFVPLLCALPACGALVPSTLLRLSALSPLAADPAQIAVRIDLPDGLSIRPDSATLVIRAETTGGRLIDEAFAIVPDETLQAWVIDAAQQPLMRATLATVRDWEERDPRGTSGSLTVSAGFCATGDGPEPNTTVSIAIRTETAGAFLPLLRDAPVAEVARAGGHDMTALAACGSPPVARVP